MRAILALISAIVIGFGALIAWQRVDSSTDEITSLGLPTPAEDVAVPGEKTALITVGEGDTARGIGEALEDEGVIDSARLFRALVGLMGLENDLGAGEYEFPVNTPVLTVIEQMPFDRERTAMKGFPLCVRCQAEYADATDRRYHAQVIACPDCETDNRITEKQRGEYIRCKVCGASFKVGNTYMAPSGIITRLGQEMRANRLTFDVGAVASPAWVRDARRSASSMRPGCRRASTAATRSATWSRSAPPPWPSTRRSRTACRWSARTTPGTPACCPTTPSRWWPGGWWR